MLGIKPSQRIWEKVNQVILGENAGVVLITFLDAMTSMLVQEGICTSIPQARANLAAMLISPDTDTKPGSLMPQLQAELKRLDDGKWVV